MIEGIRREHRLAENDEVISFRNRYTGTAIFVSLEDLTTWTRDYFLRGGALLVRPPNETEREDGTVVVVELASTEGISVEIEYYE